MTCALVVVTRNGAPRMAATVEVCSRRADLRPPCRLVG